MTRCDTGVVTPLSPPCRVAFLRLSRRERGLGPPCPQPDLTAYAIWANLPISYGHTRPLHMGSSAHKSDQQMGRCDHAKWAAMPMRPNPESV
jgi:hypothetical protein